MSGRGTARIAAAVVVAALAACGSEGGTPPPSTPHPSPSATASPTATPGAVTIGSSLTVIAPLGLRLRDSGSTDGAVVGSLGQGTVVTVLAHGGAGGHWYQVKGETETGWITDDPVYSSPRHFELYQSDAHGFSALYLDTWQFAEGGATSVSFRPQSGGYPRITAANGPTLDALGAPGMAGYATVEVDAAEVFGITGVLKLYTRGGTAPPATPGDQPPPARLAELLVTLDAKRAMRLDFLYPSPDDLRTFRDFYGSIIVPVAAASPGATPRPT